MLFMCAKPYYGLIRVLCLMGRDYKLLISCLMLDKHKLKHYYYLYKVYRNLVIII